MRGKKSKQFFFEVSLNWLGNNNGSLSAADAEGKIEVATPAILGGNGKPWSAEHLFIGSISSDFMTTYIAFAKKLQFNISNFECNTIGQIEIIEKKYKFTHINLYPRITIENDSLREQANLALKKTHSSCLISNSINADIYYHSEILINNTQMT